MVEITYIKSTTGFNAVYVGQDLRMAGNPRDIEDKFEDLRAQHPYSPMRVTFLTDEGNARVRDSGYTGNLHPMETFFSLT